MNRLTKSWSLGLGLFLAAGSGVLAVGMPAQASGTLIYGLPAETDIMDPHATGGWITYHVTYQMFEGFVKEDLTDPDVPTPELVPGLATHWEISDDGLEYTFHLREGVRFHDGTPFDAEAVKFNFDRFWNEESEHFFPKAKAFVAAYTRWIEDVEVVDPMTVRITLNAPNYEWIRSGLQSYGQPLMISPASVMEHGNDGVALNPVGTGPFRFVERDHGVKIELARNDDYWGEPAKLERIVFRPLEDPATRVNALRTGEVHMIGVPPWDEIEDLEAEGFVLSVNENVPNFMYIHFNNQHEILQDPRVRRAISMAIDREGLAQSIFAGTGRPFYGMLSPGTFAYDPDFKMHEYDPEGAKALLAEAGYPDGFSINWDIYQYGTGEIVESWIQRDLRRVGVNVEMQLFEWVAYLGRWAGGQPDDVAMNHINWGMTVPSWTGIVARCDSFPPNGINSGWYCNPKVDELLDQAVAERDEARAAEIYQEANRIIMEDAGFAPIMQDLQPMMTAPNVRGFVNPPENWFDFSTVYIE